MMLSTVSDNNHNIKEVTLQAVLLYYQYKGNYNNNVSHD